MSYVRVNADTDRCRPTSMRVRCVAISDTSRSKQAAAAQWSLVIESRWVWTESGVRSSSANVDHGFAMMLEFGEGVNVGKLGDGKKTASRG